MVLKKNEKVKKYFLHSTKTVSFRNYCLYFNNIRFDIDSN